MMMMMIIKCKIQEFMYRDKRMGNLKCTTVPVIIGATGIVTGSLRKNLETVPATHSTDSLQDSYTWNITHNM